METTRTKALFISLLLSATVLSAMDKESDREEEQQSTTYKFNVVDVNGEDALMYAAKTRYFPDSIGLLIKANVNIDRRNKHGETALSLAIEHHNHEGTKVLIEAKADVNNISKTGQTPLMLASAKGGTSEILVLLIEAIKTSK